MRAVNLADAKVRLSELVGDVAAGETVQILRRGKPVAQISAARKRLKRIDEETYRHDAQAATIRRGFYPRDARQRALLMS